VISQTLNNSIQQNMERILRKELQQSLVPVLEKTLGTIMENALLKPLQETVRKSLQTFAPKLEGIFKETLDKSIQQALKDQLKSGLETTIESALRQPVQQTFLTYFKDILVPSFEQSCQTMFRQLNNTFTDGIKDISASSSSQATANLDASILGEQMRIAVQTLMDVTTNMSASIIDTQSKLLLAHTSSLRGPTMPPPTAPPMTPYDTNYMLSNIPTMLPPAMLPLIATQTPNPQMELQRLVAQNRLQEAFDMALSAANLSLVVWLCGIVEPSSVFGAHPVRINQPVLLSLIQQLGYDLSSDTTLKLRWLQQAILCLDPRDLSVASHVPAILARLLANLEEHYPRFSDNSNPCSTSFKVLLHVVNSLLTSHKQS